MFDKTPCRVIQIPARQNHYQCALVTKARQEIICKPFPRSIPHCFTHGFRSTFDRIIDHAEVEAFSGDRSSNRSVAEVTFCILVFEDLVIARPTTGRRGYVFDANTRAKYALVLEAIVGTLQSPIRAYAESIRERPVDHFDVRIVTRNPRYEVNNLQRLAVLRRGLKKYLWP